MGVAAQGGGRKRRLAKRKPRPKYVFPRLEPLAECKKSERGNTLQRYWFSATCHASLLARTGLPHQEATVRYSEGRGVAADGRAGSGGGRERSRGAYKPLTNQSRSCLSPRARAVVETDCEKDCCINRSFI